MEVKSLNATLYQSRQQPLEPLEPLEPLKRLVRYLFRSTETATMQQLINPFLELLREVYLGADGQHTYVIDPAPGNAILPAVKKLTAKEASVPSHQGGTTVAAHTGHLKWAIDYAMEFFKGNMPKWNWEESWTRITVNEAEWKQLQEELETAFKRMATAISEVKDWSNPMFVKGTLALLPHASYHLGAIKQLILAVKHPEKAAIGLQ